MSDYKMYMLVCKALKNELARIKLDKQVIEWIAIFSSLSSQSINTDIEVN